jgi:hypothetical protein
VANDPGHCAVQDGRLCSGRPELLITFLERADVISRRKVDSNGRDRGRSAGSGDVTADHAVGWLFQACVEESCGARLRIASQEDGDFFRFVPISYPFRTTPG